MIPVMKEQSRDEACARCGAALDSSAASAPALAMPHAFISIRAARRASKDESIHRLWVDARECSQFRELGWEELQPHLDGAALFVHRPRAKRWALAHRAGRSVKAPQAIGQGACAPWAATVRPLSAPKSCK